MDNYDHRPFEPILCLAAKTCTYPECKCEKLRATIGKSAATEKELEE
jgi:hypothetical protein